MGESVKLQVPIARRQILAALRLYKRQPVWQADQKMLAKLKSTFRRNNHSAILIKVLAVNAIYSTRLLAVVPMTNHICDVLKNRKVNRKRPIWVERVARLRSKQGKIRYHRSFASKFAHLFIDDDRFPIQDSVAIRMLGLHLGRGAFNGRSRPRNYLDFVNAFEQFRQVTNLSSYSIRDIDLYLWIRGLYEQYKLDAHAKINGEAKNMFRGRYGSVKRDLRQLVTTGVKGRPRS